MSRCSYEHPHMPWKCLRKEGHEGGPIDAHFGLSTVGYVYYEEWPAGEEGRTVDGVFHPRWGTVGRDMYPEDLADAL